MFFSMAISLYTSRVVLLTLGVMDYGLWNVVAGVVGMFSFLNASMTGCTNRFLSFELGKGDYASLQKYFSAAITFHLIIACVILLLGETIGLWFLKEKLVIPQDRIVTAEIIYQLAIISSMVSVTQVPYNAMIMANEKMDVYAYIEILNICLRLIIVYLLLISPWDKLISYGVLTLVVSIGITLIYRLYCTRKLQSCKFRLLLDKSIMIPMINFSGWDLYGNAAVMARTQGVNMLLNIFFTATMNAASAIATSVQTAIMSFASNVLSAFRPQIVKTYANGELPAMVELIKKAAVFTTLLLMIFTIPILTETDYILQLWLKNPPEYAAILCRWVLIFNVIANLSSVFISGVHATGYIKRSSFINGTCYLLVIPFSYIAYRNGMAAEYAFIFNVIAVCIGMVQNMIVLHNHVHEFKKRIIFTKVILRFLFVSIATYIIVDYSKTLMPPSFARLCLSTSISTILLGITSYFFIFTNSERKFVISKTISIAKHFHR